MLAGTCGLGMHDACVLAYALLPGKSQHTCVLAVTSGMRRLLQILVPLSDWIRQTKQVNVSCD